ncbi:uncharacterized protein LOC117173489 isoform X4 [Belonocnema kinseyi]|uniref:uncharacterized protein LOC117173489 isoform X4 n=1 Tax=Belonocnema kinseyi TaxID=2817044 RepID=UPI00143D40E8|nr:uncharacterized protein LOC117173489 isoform X4 [Belonocnema kinseyi]
MAPNEEIDFKLQYTAAIIASMTAVGYGSSAAWTSPALPYLTSETSHLPISKEQSDWIASLLTIEKHRV